MYNKNNKKKICLWCNTLKHYQETCRFYLCIDMYRIKQSINFFIVRHSYFGIPLIHCETVYAVTECVQSRITSIACHFFSLLFFSLPISPFLHFPLFSRFFFFVWHRWQCNIEMTQFVNFLRCVLLLRSATTKIGGEFDQSCCPLAFLPGHPVGLSSNFL